MMEIPQVQIPTQPLEVDDFRGGATDYYLGGPVEKAKTVDNLHLVPFGEKAKLLTRQGSEIHDDDYPQIPAGNQRIGTLKVFENTLLVHSKEKLHYISSGWQTLQGPSSNDMFPSGTTSEYLSMAVWNRHLLVASSGYHLPVKVYPDASNVLKLRTAGLPALATAPTCTPTAGANTYIYAFVYYYTYQVGTLIYEDYGPVTQVLVGSAAEPSSGTMAVTVIHAISNGATGNYDTGSANLKVRIYRTSNAGTTFYYVGQVNNGTATFNDTTSDASIIAANIQLYTTGGVIENEPPPLCKLVHVEGDIAYYGNTKEGTEIHANRLMQAVPGDIDSCPADFYTDGFDGGIAGLSGFKGSPIVMCDNGSVYRVDGVFDLFGRGGMFPQKIADAADCISGQGVVKTMDGVFWAGSDGIWYTDGYSVVRLNEDYDQSWATFVESATQKARIQGKYDSKKRRIWWTIQDEGETDCTKCYVLYLDFGIRQNASFATMTGTNDSFAPTAIEFNAGVMYRGDRRGYLFRHEDLLYTDPKVDLDESPEDWETTLLQYTYTSCAFNVGGMERMFIPRIDITCENETNLSLQITSINDDNAAGRDLKPIRSRSNLTWGDEDVLWGDDIAWNSEGMINEWRRFPATALRCQYKQITLTNAFVAITSSDALGTATVDNGASTATLTDAATRDWLSTIVDYYIAFETDEYAKEYPITARTSDNVITFSDPAGSAPNAALVEWVIRGYPRGEVLNLIGYRLHVSVFGKTQNTFLKAQSGEVGAA